MKNFICKNDRALILVCQKGLISYRSEVQLSIIKSVAESQKFNTSPIYLMAEPIKSSVNLCSRVTVITLFQLQMHLHWKRLLFLELWVEKMSPFLAKGSKHTLALWSNYQKKCRQKFVSWDNYEAKLISMPSEIIFLVFFFKFQHIAKEEWLGENKVKLSNFSSIGKQSIL